MKKSKYQLAKEAVLNDEALKKLNERKSYILALCEYDHPELPEINSNINFRTKQIFDSFNVSEAEMGFKKPPVGLMPENIWRESVNHNWLESTRRMIDIESTIDRYNESEKDIPEEWLDEYQRIADNLSKGSCDCEKSLDTSFTVWREDFVFVFPDSIWDELSNIDKEILQSRLNNISYLSENAFKPFTIKTGFVKGTRKPYLLLRRNKIQTNLVLPDLSLFLGVILSKLDLSVDLGQLIISYYIDKFIGKDLEE